VPAAPLIAASALPYGFSAYVLADYCLVAAACERRLAIVF
jgi:hypothetical protein